MTRIKIDDDRYVQQDSQEICISCIQWEIDRLRIEIEQHKTRLIPVTDDMSDMIRNAVDKWNGDITFTEIAWREQQIEQQLLLLEEINNV